MTFLALSLCNKPNFDDFVIKTGFHIYFLRLLLLPIIMCRIGINKNRINGTKHIFDDRKLIKKIYIMHCIVCIVDIIPISCNGMALQHNLDGNV